MSYFFTTYILLVSLITTLDCARPPPKIQDAIEYLEREVPKLSDSQPPSGDAWSERFLDVVQALSVHPTYKEWLDEDEKRYKSQMQTQEDAPLSFPCDITPSSVIPKSVHKLRPSDIKVVSAIGDSLTAANGALTTSVIGLLLEYRGYAWNMGGQVHQREHTTKSNIFKLYNKNLYGYSTGTGSVYSPYSFLNMAVPGSIASDMPQQARDLVEKMKADSSVNFQNDWKIITLFIGGNDVCGSCKDKAYFHPDNFIRYVREALDYLHQQVPRAFVNAVELLDVSLVKELKDGSQTCSVLLGSMLCRCAAFPDDDAAEKEIDDLIAEYQKRLRDLIDSGRYDTRDDFTVVNQPFFRHTAPPRLNDGKYDFSFLAPDCFHFSGKGHSHSGKALWNNMLEEVGKKSTQWDPQGGFLCPTSNRPYLATRKN